MAEFTDDQKRYLADKKIHFLFNHFVTALMHEQPADPIEFLTQAVPAARGKVEGFPARAGTGAAVRQVQDPRHPAILSEKALTIVVLGASGDLAKKKTYPALFGLYCVGLLPRHAQIVGYARSALSERDFKERIKPLFKKTYGTQVIEDFLGMCTYISGQYDNEDDFGRLDRELVQIESRAMGGPAANRLFYLALPPTVFVDVIRCIRARALGSSGGWNRVIIEKPFGTDSASSAELSRKVGALLTEDQIYRIDHYLGKEMVQNLVVLRFANKVFSHTFNRNCISNVQITFKEPFGTGGRGGYFDKFGIIRDILQNHLLQVLALVAMEKPKTLEPERLRDEKVQVLRCIPPVEMRDVVLGQYVKAADGSGEAYLDDPTVPKGSRTPTFASMVLWINNDRWAGVPFIMKAAKAMNERKAEVRIQFKEEVEPFHSKAHRDELVFRIQPNEAIYMKVNAKQPGLSSDIHMSELDLSYQSRYEQLYLPEAYESLIYECMLGNSANFVRSDELAAAWEIFTPVLHQIEREKPMPIPYEFGGRGPKEADELLRRVGYVHNTEYTWRAVSKSK